MAITENTALMGISLLATRVSWADVFGPGAAGGFLLALAINSVVSTVALLLGLVRPSGAFAGAALGTVVLAFGTAPLYLLLFIFFGVGTLATRFRKGRKPSVRRFQERWSASTFASAIPSGGASRSRSWKR